MKGLLTFCNSCEWTYDGACKKCKKNTREVIKTYTSDEEFLNHRCNHKFDEHGFRTFERRGLIIKKIPLSQFDRRWAIKSMCPVCLTEIRKELAMRYRIKQKHDKNKQRESESLATKCCKIIARDPGMLLLAAVNNPPLDNLMWQNIYEQVPAKMTERYKQELAESMKVNEAKVMYKTIAKVFSRYN